MDNFPFPRISPPTICPKDLVARPENGHAHHDSACFISKPQGLPSEDVNMEDKEMMPSPAEQTGAMFEEPWPEVFDDLFAHSVGLERILECLEKVQTSKGQDEDEVDDCQSTARFPLLGSELQTRLIELYFRQFHPICPAVDEAKFLEWYESSHNSQHTQPRSMQLLLYSLLFSGSSYLEQDELQWEPYPTVTQLQKALFTFAQAQYHLLEQEELGAEPLVQTALLLSYWSPYDGTREVNSFWSNEATRHAVAGGLSGPSSKARSRIIWWCCVIRNRMISIGLRRPSLLKGRINGPLPEIGDFGEEVSHPRFVSREAKVYFARAFHLLCSLTSTMAECTQLQYRAYTKSWELPAGQQSTQLLKKVRTLDEKLTIWNANFARLYATVKDMAVPRTDLIIFHLLGLMHQFALSILYEPFLSMSSGTTNPKAWLVKDHAFLKINQVSTTTASITASMLQHAQPKDLPIILLPWIILPMALHLVQLGEPRAFEDRREVVQRLGYLMRILHSLQGRYEGAQFVRRIIDAIILFVRKFDTCTPKRESGASQSLSNESVKQEDLISQVLEVIKNGLAAEVILD